MNGYPDDIISQPSNIDAAGHVRGTSVYLDDIPVMEGTLFASIFDSPHAHGVITRLDLSKALHIPGVVRIFSAKDVPGQNQIGGIVPDEPLFAENEVHFQGQPILLIVAESSDIAEDAIEAIQIEIDPLPVVTDPREAFAKGSLLSKSRTFRIGDVATAFASSAHIFEGKAETGGQEHLYLETQGAYAYPLEGGNLRISSSTQGLRHVQETVAHVLGLGMNRVEVDTTRLGGGFGGKEDQAAMFACMAALAASQLQRPVKCIPGRMEDMRMTGKRNPYSSDYKIGLDNDLKIIAYEATFYQNGGAAADLSPAILERTLFHATNCYDVPNALLTAHSCRTNLPPNTAFRGFGGPQGMFVMEAALDHAAKELGLPKEELQRRNLFDNGSVFPYGQVVDRSQARNCWDTATRDHDLESVKRQIYEFNLCNDFYKKGYALMPVCFGISFTNTRMNQARALVHVYWDGTVSVSTGAVEMGQGVNTKMMQVAAACFGISQDKIRLESTNTTRVANTSPSAASATSDLNGKALVDACSQVMDRLKQLVKQVLHTDSDDISIRDERVFIGNKMQDLDWQQLVQRAFFERINLSAKGHYATPLIHFNKDIEKGHPFAYHVYGTAITTVTVDCIRGIYEIDSVSVVHDFGSSLNRKIDLGQIEGGIVQGIGWMTMEEVNYNEAGKLLSNSLSTYKIPDIYAVPKEIKVGFLHAAGHEMAIFGSKAVGEPPLMYGIGTYFAIRHAILQYNSKAHLPYSAPLTPEKVLMALYGK